MAAAICCCTSFPWWKVNVFTGGKQQPLLCREARLCLCCISANCMSHYQKASHPSGVLVLVMLLSRCFTAHSASRSRAHGLFCWVSAQGQSSPCLLKSRMLIHLMGLFRECIWLRICSQTAYSLVSSRLALSRVTSRGLKKGISQELKWELSAA